MSAAVLTPGVRAAARSRAATGTRPPLSVLLSAAVLLVVLAWSLAPGLLTGHDPAIGIPDDKFIAPGAAYWLGTDHLGRDLLTRIIHGSASSMTSALIAVAIGLVLGGLLGLLAGYLGGIVDAVVSRVVEVLLAIPGFLLAVVVVTALGYDTRNAAIATGVSAVAVFARLMRAEVLRVRTSVFIEAARVNGGSSAYVLFRHVLPNALRPVLSLAVLQFGIAILVIAGLAFLGYGDPPPASDWGLLVSDGREHLIHAPWLVIAPGIVIAVVVLSVSRLSRWLDQGRNAR
ncbi:ABC transporter permease [Brachybacterium aquaticum]|uniref:Peptide/nickel transport system permease protein n=1 Tax=Brachybacterium aquaticum TaxID=1432564 RepID=A0A841AGB1_9MICO|nr:ABC transporter permease [Brachybacterium aquaticum]MBB5832302.1 peptide/nickel transport system permease protein [Brachybacterium aquaticum]